MKAILGVLALAVVCLAAVLGFRYWQGLGQQGASFRTAPVERGSVWATISATGSVQPVERIDVGAQVAGQIKAFGRDPQGRAIDYCSVVEEGTVLAQLDDTLFRSRVAQAKANLQRSEAEIELARARVMQTASEWERAQRLGPQRAVSGADYDLAQVNHETAKASLLVSAANVELAKAALQEAQTNLGYTTIRSPVKGVIIDRRVNIGQTVVASLSAPSMFIISPDLSKMQVWAAVNEADVGQVYVGQPVRFTVDSRPDEVFTGQVYQIRLNATMTQNVVIYTVVVNTDNAEGKLLPNLTANLQFDVSRRDDVLTVPNAALRWKPQLQAVAPDVRDDYAKSLRRKAAAAAGRASPVSEERLATVWVEDAGFVRPVKVRTGISDGTVTEILEGELEEGTPVVVGEGGGNGGEQTVNPFTPQFGRNRQQ